MTAKKLTDFDLSKREGRYQARQAGFDVPKRTGGFPSVDFWTLVDKSGDCWIWLGAVGHNGYGMHSYKGKTVRAHRHAWVLAHGEIPSGDVVMHMCDNRKCVRATHLRVGTQRENMRDASEKLRLLHGERNRQSSLTEQDVRDIRANHRAGRKSGEWTTSWVAKRYGIDASAVRHIVTGKTWKHLERRRL